MRFNETICATIVSGLICVGIAFGQTPDKKPADPGSAETHRPHAGMLRFPDISATHIVFAYANDLWVVGRDGGVAWPLASPPGQESFPRFSPDGKSIAFVGNYEGNRDLYTTTVDGGAPTRVTYHPSVETLCDWTPNNKLLYFSNGQAGLPRQLQLFTTSPEGGLPSKLPVPYGANGSIDADGKWLAYTPHTTDNRTWKRYRGGMATDIWLFNLEDHKSKKITDWEGTDSQPMWLGKKVYYMSDAGPEHRLNIWSYDPMNEKREQITKVSDFDVKWPSIGPGANGKGEIVFQNGPQLSVVALDTGAVRNVDVIVPGDRPTIRQKEYDASKFIQGYGVSSSGQRALVQARGDVWTIPAKKGTPRNLTHTAGAAERDPAWSPDGQWIAYFSDATGDYELYVMQSDGRGEPRKLTSDGGRYRFQPTWSPDSKRITFTDNTGALFVHAIDPAETKLIDRDPYGNMGRASWSSDSDWIAYSKAAVDQVTNAIWLYQVSKDEKTKVTAGMFNDTWPTFDRKGDYLFFASSRNFNNPIYEDLGTTFVYASTDMLFAVPLRAEIGSPWAPKSDEEKWGEEKKKEEEKAKEKEKEKGKDDKKKDDDKKDEKDKEKKATSVQDAEKTDAKADSKDDKDSEKKDEKAKDEPKPVSIELEGFEKRAIASPIPKGNFTNISVNHEGKVLYVRNGLQDGESKPAIKIFDITDEEKKEKTVLEEVGQFAMSADGKKIIVRKDQTMAIVDAAAEQKIDKPVPLGDMMGRVDPRAEWKQMFNEAWRIQREYFYDPNMHVTDWKKLRDRYGRMIEDCASREDLDYVIGEMISELNVGHAYVRGGGDYEKEKEVSVGMLGADFQLDGGAYKIAKIQEGAAWDYDGRGPLSQPGINVKVGDYLLAVNGNPVDPKKDPWAAFQGLGGKVVHLTVSDKPTLDDTARHVVVELLKNENDVRYRAWIEEKRKYVEEKSGGKIGYIYVPNTGVNGQNDLFRQFFGQKDRAALIVDERWNGGGQIPTRFIELLNRPITNYWATRAERDWTWPPDAHAGPKCMLINGLAGSGGDCFPYYFRQSKLGKLIGTRTWGGLVGISGNPQLIDGGQTSAPTFAFYEADGTWGVEGHGVDPDIEVIDDPALMVNGGDPQLDAAIKHLLGECDKNGYCPPKRPKYPDRSGMGIAAEDK
jgi:tricorn protease